ncbi:MAG TPA: hypothetical protein VH142_20085, partial [Polyangiaceae bacterium]|nr:hypothetical protein [Polyangiaceae bacterium]
MKSTYGTRALSLARALRVLVVSLFGLSCNGCLYARIFYFNTPTLNAPSYFDERVVHASSAPLPLAKSAAESTFPLTPKERAKYGSLDALLEREKTRAFLVIHDDQVVYERYFDGFSAAT